MDLEYPKWQAPLAAAFLEFSPRQLREKLQEAEDAIAKRIQELRFAENNEHELRSLFDGLSIIRGVKQDRLESPPEEGG
jgi:hypothetical protein